MNNSRGPRRPPRGGGAGRGGRRRDEGNRGPGSRGSSSGQGNRQDDPGRRRGAPDSGYRPPGSSSSTPGPYGERGDRRRRGSEGRPGGARRGSGGGGQPRNDRNDRGDRNDRRRPQGRDQRRPDRGQRRREPVPTAARPEAAHKSGIDPFELFCAYYLGITADKKFRNSNIHEVARRFAKGPGEIKQALQDFGMDAAVVMEKDFDMALAQLDIELAPEGIDRVELARQLWIDFQEAPRRKINWEKIIEEDRRENAKVFGRRD